MKILLDECVPWPMHKLLPGHNCQSAKLCGWGGIKNGELLRLAESEYEVFITADQNIRYQQNLSGRTIAVLELSTNNLHRITAAAEIEFDKACDNVSLRAPGRAGFALKAPPHQVFTD